MLRGCFAEYVPVVGKEGTVSLWDLECLTLGHVLAHGLLFGLCFYIGHLHHFDGS